MTHKIQFGGRTFTESLFRGSAWNGLLSDSMKASTLTTLAFLLHVNFTALF